MSLIEVRNLHFRYPDGTAALEGIDFTLEQGETVALLGANGSGKTTFALHLVGLLRGEGEIRIDGLDALPHNYAAIRRKVGLLFQDPDEQLFMPTVLEDVTFGPMNVGVPEDKAVREARDILRSVGVTDGFERAPYHLSAGEKRRVALAGILILKPDILVLDEPTTYLDPPGQAELTKLLSQLPQAKILVTHDVRFAESLAQRAVFFQNGRVGLDGPVEEVINHFGWRSQVAPCDNL